MRLFVGIYMFLCCIVSCAPVQSPPVTEPIALSADDARIARSGLQWVGTLGGLLPLLTVPHLYPKESFRSPGFEQATATFQSLYQDLLDARGKGCAKITSPKKHELLMTLSGCGLGSEQAQKISGAITLSFALDESRLLIATHWKMSGLKVGGVEVTGTLTSEVTVFRFGLVELSVKDGTMLTLAGERSSMKKFAAEISQSDKDGEMLYELKASGDLAVGDATLSMEITRWQQRSLEDSPHYGLLALHLGSGGERHVVELLFLEQTPKVGVVEVQVDGRKAGQKTSMDLLSSGS